MAEGGPMGFPAYGQSAFHMGEPDGKPAHKQDKQVDKEFFSMPPIFSHSVCHINLGAIARNFRKLGNPENLLPVVKSDAYGHGLPQVADTLRKAGATGFAAGTLEEGVFLREAGHTGRILLLLGCRGEEELRQAFSHDLWPLIVSFEDLEAAVNAASGRTARIALKFETGMGRLGFARGQLYALLEKLRRHPNLEPALACTHLATADMPEKIDATTRQIQEFEAISRELGQHYPDISFSLGNSAALALSPGGISRPGLALYGGNPLAGTPAEKSLPQLEWAMSLEAPIIQIRELASNAPVSYGGLYRTPKAARVAVIEAGYGQGISRSLSNRMKVLINGRSCAQVGRICMGMLMADVTDLPEVQAGDSAWIFGGEPLPGEKAQTPADLAALQQTIPYEILCLAGSLNQRKFHNN